MKKNFQTILLFVTTNLLMLLLFGMLMFKLWMKIK